MVFGAWKRRSIAQTRNRHRELVGALPIPTPEQTEDFANFVVNARSWHKHLPCAPPGATFVFFLDPNAGRQLVQTATGRITYVDRVDGQVKFHYTWMPTSEYHTRFGHWHYTTDHGTLLAFSPPGARDTELHGSGLGEIVAPDGTTIPIPPDVLSAGTMTMTAHVHDIFGADWLRFWADMHPETPPHDAEDRDERVALYESYRDDLPGLDRVIGEERTRLRAELRTTLLRVRSLLASG